MSGLCKISQFLGAKVVGSDANCNDETIKLCKAGVQVFYGHDAKNISQDVDLVVYSGAIKSDNVELQQAKKLGIKCMERSQFLGIISRLFDNVIAISGTHGKTTTCAMIGTILNYAGYNPTIHLGGESINLNDNTVIGGDKYFVVEACEYRESFKYLRPSILAVTNIEADHLDYYKDIDDIANAFQRLANNSKFVIKDKNEKIYCEDNYLIGKDFEIINERFENNVYTFSVKFQGEYFDSYTISMFGRHNVENSLFAIAVCYKLGVSKDDIREGLRLFAGVKRRYEKIGEKRNIPIFIDYAHHPTEIKNSIAGIKEIYGRPLIIFQPHTYSRTKALKKEFVEVLQGNIIIYKTYPAREQELEGGRAIDLFEELSRNKDYSCGMLGYCENDELLSSQIAEYIEEDKIDCVLILGAGDLAEKMRKYYK